MPIISPEEFMKTYKPGPAASAAVPEKSDIISPQDFMRTYKPSPEVKPPVEVPVPEPTMARGAPRPVPPNFQAILDTITKVGESGEDTARGAARGVSSGFADEIAGAYNSLFGKSGPTMTEDYKKGRDEYRLKEKASNERSPWLFNAGDIAGSALPAAFTGGETLIPRLGMYAAQGGLRGLGESEAETPLGDVGNAAGGAAAGLAFGSAGEYLANKASPLLKMLMSPREIKAAQKSGTPYYEEHAVDTLSDLTKGKYTQKDLDDVRRLEELNKTHLEVDPTDAQQSKWNRLDKEVKDRRRNRLESGAADRYLIPSALGAVGGALTGTPAGSTIGALALPAAKYAFDKGKTAGVERLIKQLESSTLPGLNPKEAPLDSEALARAFNAVRNVKPGQAGKITSTLGTATGRIPRELAGGAVNAMGDVIASPFSGSADEPDQDTAQEEILKQVSEAARKEEKLKRGGDGR